MDIVCLGELLVDFFPLEIGRNHREVSAYKPVPGGAPANVAVAAARLGSRSAYIGKVGQDDFGYWLAEVIAKENVETRGVRFDPLVRTTINFLTQPDVNSYTCLFFRNPGADACLRPDELDQTLLHNAKAFHFGGVSLSEEPCRAATKEAARVARSAGAITSFDVNYRPPLWKNQQEARAEILSVVPLTDVLKVNEAELELLTGCTDMTAAKGLLALGPRLCVVTLGPGGSHFITQSAEGFVPAFPVRAVDGAGCGDAFIAALLTKLIAISNWDERLSAQYLRESLRYSNAVGALTATQQGVIPALPTSSQVTEFLGFH